MVITLTGKNTFLLRAELDMLVSDFVAEYTDMGLERLDGEEIEYDRIREAVESLPFLASKKMVVLRSPSAQKKFIEEIDSLLEGVPETTDLIIVEPKLDKRLSYYKTLKKGTEYREFNELDEIKLVNWLVESARSEGGNISRSDASFLVRRLGTNQQLLRSELTKLLLYAPKITKQTIELLTETTPQSSIFDLLDAALAGKTAHALNIYEDQRKQKVEPLAIMGLLGWQLHVLAVIKTAGERTPDEIASEAKLSPYVVRKSSGLARSMTLAELKELIAEAHQLDIRLKSESIDADEAMRLLIIRLGNR
ncbi:DNA polymerase III subunit delta [soil metagenome]